MYLQYPILFSTFTVFDQEILSKPRSKAPRLPHTIEELRHVFLVIAGTKLGDILRSVTGYKGHIEATKRYGLKVQLECSNLAVCYLAPPICVVVVQQFVQRREVLTKSVMSSQQTVTRLTLRCIGRYSFRSCLETLASPVKTPETPLALQIRTCLSSPMARKL